MIKPEPEAEVCQRFADTLITRILSFSKYVPDLMGLLATNLQHEPSSTLSTSSLVHVDKYSANDGKLDTKAWICQRKNKDSSFRH